MAYRVIRQPLGKSELRDALMKNLGSGESFIHKVSFPISATAEIAKLNKDSIELAPEEVVEIVTQEFGNLNRQTAKNFIEDVRVFPKTPDKPNERDFTVEIDLKMSVLDFLRLFDRDLTVAMNTLDHR